MAKRIQIGGRIESKEVGGIVTGAAEILDDAKGKKQSVINGETDDELLRLDQSKQDNLTFDNAPTEGSNNPVKSGGVYAADKALSDAIEAILLLIPSAASGLNKLVDTAMMNSSISTATATFKGTYNVVTDLSLTIDATHEQIAAALGNAISTADNNDYAFVQIPVSAESMDIRRTERYKFNGTAWGYEYDLNTSGFTAAQWAAINSGITLALVGKLIGLPTSSELQALLGQKQDTLTFDNVPTAGSANPVKSGGVYSAINDEKTAREQLGQTVTGIDGRVENVEEVIPTGAAANNKLVANNSMEAYVTSIIEAITASFTIATADGHINLTLTQTNGRVASLTLTSSDIASAQALTALTGRVSTAESDITTLGGRVSTNETDIANLQQLYNDLQQSKPVPVTELPETGQQQGVIYRLAGSSSYSDYMWNGSTWVLMATYNNAIDPRPKKASQNLVTSGGVFDNMGALDVSELNATENPHTLAQYVDLSAALAAIPTDYQKGGMSIKYVQSSDNKYVQYRLMSDTFNTTVANWQGVDEKPTAGSDNLVKSGGVASNYITANKTVGYIWNNNDFEQGTINPQTGEKAASTYVIRSSKRHFVKGDKIFIELLDSEQRYIIGTYVNGSCSATSWSGEDAEYEVPNTCDIIILVSHRTQRDFTPDENRIVFMSNRDLLDSLYDDIKDNKRYTDYTSANSISSLWNKNEFAQGGVNPSTGEIITTTTRIYSPRKYCKSGEILQITVPHGQKVVIGTYVGSSYSASQWFTDNFDYTVINDCEIIALVSYLTDADITPSDNLCSFIYKNEVLNVVKKAIDEDLSDINSHALNYLWTVNDFEQGTINPVNGEKAESSTRIRTKNKKFFKAGQSFSIVLSNSQKVIIGTYSNGGYSPSSWLYGSFVYTVANDCELCVLVSNKNDSNITPDNNNSLFVANWDIISKYIPDAYTRNKSRNTMLVAASSNGEKLQLCLVTDTHNDVKRYANAVNICESFKTINMLMALGDYVEDTMYDRSAGDYIFEETEDMSKPMLLVLGNHDVGNDIYIPYTIDNEEAYSIWFAPLHQRGLLSNVENEPGTCYWYKDFVTYGIRVIGLNCYDEDIEYEERDWEAIDYDASYDLIATSTTYSAGDKVNVPNYVKKSFQAVHNITTASSLRGNTDSTGPHYKCKRGTFVIGEEQANWFADTLNSTPNGYGIVVVLHGPFSSECHNQSSLKFANKAMLNERSDAGTHYMMQTDFLAGLVNAYINRTVYDSDVRMTGTASYMNKYGSGDTAYAYHITKDFNSAKGKFLYWLGGHWHKDIIWRHDTYTNQYQVSPTWTNEKSWYALSGQETDIITSEINDVANDCITVVTFNVQKDEAALVKLGQNYTILGEHRDFEILKKEV